MGKIGSTEVVDTYEPKDEKNEECLENVETKRMISFIEITLSLDPLDTAAIGYQPPIPEDQVDEKNIEDLIKGKDRGGEGEDGEKRPRGRGKKGGKGRGRRDDKKS